MRAVPPEEIAKAMDCPVALVDDLPFLLEGVDSLGCDTARLIGILDDAGVARTLPALDLGCGKGAFSVALAERGHTVTGLDAFAPFVDSAKSLALSKGVAHRCTFRHGDVREASRDALYGLVALISVGRPFGTLTQTIGAMLEMAAPGGWALIEDSYRAAPVPVPGYEEYGTLDETIMELRAITNAEALRIEHDEPDVSDAYEQDVQAVFTRRCEEFVAREPAKAHLIREFLEMQRAMALMYERDLPRFLALLRRKP